MSACNVSNKRITVETKVASHILKPKMLIFIFFVTFSHSSALASDVTKKEQGILKQSPLTEIKTAIGSRAKLPCSVTPMDSSDYPILVLIYQGSIGTPIFSLDARGGSLSGGDNWSDPMVLGSRARFELNKSRSGLIIDPVEEKDEAVYRCRVDFRYSPTRNTRIKLDVAVPPSEVNIITDEGLEGRDLTGPYVEGSSLTLHCSVKGGKPSPVVTWLKGAHIMDMTSEVEEDDRTVNTLFIPKLTRNFLNKIFVCEASNSNYSKPISASVKIDMIFSVQKVEIYGGKEAVREGTARKLTCKASGSRPPAEISWYKNGAQVPSSFEKVLEAGNVVKSSLIIIPKGIEDGMQIICRAKNPAMEGSVLEDSQRIRVHYVPILKLVPGKGLDVDDVKEGDDFYFECEIQSNPKVQITHWFYEGKELNHNISAGIIHSNQSLVLQKVKKEMTGNYRCSSENSLGSGSSQTIFLKVKSPAIPKTLGLHYSGLAALAVSTVIVEKYSVKCKW